MRRLVLILILLSCSAPVFAANQCTFWIGLVQQDLQFSDNAQTTTYRARYREQSRMPEPGGFRVELVQAGSRIEGTHDSMPNGFNVSSGRGTDDVKNEFPGGYVFVDKSGRPVKYQLQLHAMNDSRFTVTTKWLKDGKVTTFQRPYQSIYLGRPPDPKEPRLIEGGLMQGQYEIRESARSGRVSWSLKPVVAPCDQPPGIPDIPAEKRPKCPPPSRALLDTTWSQREAKAEQLKDHYNELMDAYNRMNDNQAAWRAAIPICAIEEIAEKTAEAILKDLGETPAEFTEVIGKMTTGDLSYILTGDYSTALKAIKNLTAILQAAIGAGDPTAMEEKLDDCKDLPEDLKNAAKAFVDAYAEVKSLMPKVQTDVNDIRSLDQKYWDQWQKYYQDCLAYAECMGKPASDCPKPPDTPSGPMP